MKKHRISLLLLCVLLGVLCFSSTALAANNIKVYLNGDRVKVTYPPVEQNGTTLVPFRSIFEALGMTVDWTAQTQTVTGSKDGLKISLVLGQKQASVNGEAKALTLPAKTIQGNTMVPLRFVAEAAGCRVNWDNANSRVVINNGDEDVPIKAEDPNADLYSIDGTGAYSGYKELKGHRFEGDFAIYYQGNADSFQVEVKDIRGLNPNQVFSWSYNGKTYKHTRSQLYGFFDDTFYFSSHFSVDTGILTPSWLQNTFGSVYQEWFDFGEATTESAGLVERYLEAQSGSGGYNRYAFADMVIPPSE